MSEKENESTGRRPDFIAYNVRDSQNEKGYWNKVGAAWQHHDGQGLDIQLESIPVDGRITLRELREERVSSYLRDRQTEAPEKKRPSRERSR